MKNCNREIKLIYRTLSDKFFVINKPVNWTLTRKKNKQKEEEGKNVKCSSVLSVNNEIKPPDGQMNWECAKEKSNIHEKKKFLLTLKNLSVAEKNAFLFTNSPLYLYNDFKFNIGGTASDQNDEKNKFIEKYYVESVLKCETNEDIYYPYKLPIYMSGLVICCRDLFIYNKFLKMIKENKLIRKYRCLINDPFVFVENNKVTVFRENGYNYGDHMNSFFVSEKNVTDSSTHLLMNNKKNEIGNKKFILFLKSLQAQKEATDMFPFHNFFSDNTYSTTYCRHLVHLGIDKWKAKINNHLESEKNNRRNDKSRRVFYQKGRNMTRGIPPVDCDYFISAPLKRNPPIKSLNHFLSNFLHNNDIVTNANGEYEVCLDTTVEECDDMESELNHVASGTEEEGEHIENDRRVNKKKNDRKSSSSQKEESKNGNNIYNIHWENAHMSKNGKVKFPASLFFNEGNFYTIDKEITKNSVSISMIYKVENYGEYVKKHKNTLFKREQNINSYVNNFYNIYIIEFVLLDNPKPDLIRFFFSELNTPIINDNLFDKKSFKKDIINETILQMIEKEQTYSSPSTFYSQFDITRHSYDKKCQVNVNNLQPNTYGTQEADKKYKEYLRKSHDPQVNAFTIPSDYASSRGLAHKEEKIKLNNYFIHQTCTSSMHSEMGNYYEQNTREKIKSKNENMNLCLELFQLQFLDPLNGDYVNIENSLPTTWI
ncbi:hypothetical protein, conserved [Plasmodium gonderi]|uniref:Uncharacterized protein n=1 Tax=Plasmodium gonderi TaxID=77519 RepID=A0A1Y1JCH0_PLAGO|nr:hypothetical protein, conserved [Plasmodium gonderi]GAW80219.1 hypothetical protein, conserved [Plasmodium gonderi]